jgi:uncharacterized protein
VVIGGVLCFGFMGCSNSPGGHDKLVQGAMPGYPFRPVPFNQVKIEDQFWASRIKTNRDVTIPYDFRKCEETGRIDNFAIAAGRKKGKHKGNVYDDSDVFKIIEGASYSLQQQYDARLDAYLDSIIGLIAEAQEPDGYLYTARTIDPQHAPEMAGKERWSQELIFGHELYNAGHMYEAAVAHYMVTKKKTFLNVAIKNANLICNTFGPGKLCLVPGHEEIEIGLVRLYGVTGDKRYIDLAKFFVDERGNKEGHELRGTYAQDDMPVVKQDKAVGHAVRACYFYCGAADVASMTNDTSYIHAIDRIWKNVAGTKLYITGGIGAKGEGEAFGNDYELPNGTAYNETCAAVANALWNYRMFLLHGESKYIDVLERVLYNGFLSGVSLEGDKFFYGNPLACSGSCRRSPWFDCSCCPSNVVRFLPSVPGYIYAVKENDLYVNLFIGSSVNLKMSGKDIELKQETNYPWDGRVKLIVHSPEKQSCRLLIRIPGWAVNQLVPSDLYAYSDNKSIKSVLIKVNDKKVNYETRNGYAIVEQIWNDNDEVSIDIPMEVRRVLANQKVEADRGYEAYERGPLVYCLEGVDNDGNVLDAMATDKNDTGYSFIPGLLKGIGVLHFKGQLLRKENKPATGATEKALLMAIPYYAWAHRGESTMTVWMPVALSSSKP